MSRSPIPMAPARRSRNPAAASIRRRASTARLPVNLSRGTGGDVTVTGAGFVAGATVSITDGTTPLAGSNAPSLVGHAVHRALRLEQLRLQRRCLDLRWRHQSRRLRLHARQRAAPQDGGGGCPAEARPDARFRRRDAAKAWRPTASAASRGHRRRRLDAPLSRASCARPRARRSGRMVLVNRLEETAVVDGERRTTCRRASIPGAVHPEGWRAHRRLPARSRGRPGRCAPATRVIERSLFMPHGRQMTVGDLAARRERAARGRARAVREADDLGPRLPRAASRERRARRDVHIAEGLVTMRPYADVPAVYLHHNGIFRARPDWYRRFDIRVERERGLDHARGSVHAGRTAARPGTRLRRRCDLLRRAAGRDR